MQDLGTLVFGTSSVATSINASGQIAGYGDEQLGPPVVFTHTFLISGGSMQDLKTLGGIASYAYSVNDSEQVVGDSLTSSGADHAFLYSSGTMQDLGTLTGGSSSLAKGINNSGQIVGRADIGKGAYHAFLYSGGAFKDLNNLVPPGSGWTLLSAQGINDFGQIVGYGISPNGQEHAFLLTPNASAFGLWISAAKGNWSDSTKWIGAVPNAVGAVAVLSASTTAAVTVTLDTPVTLGAMRLDNLGSTSVGYTLSGDGTNTLTLSGSGNNAAITVTSGSQVISTPVILADNLVVTTDGTNPWRLSFGTASSITDNDNDLSLTMSASNGTLILSGSDNYTGGTFVTAGTLIVTNADALPDGTSLTAGADAASIFDSSQAIASPITPSEASQINPVPEPSTLALLAVAVCGAAVGQRLRVRRRKQ